VTGKRRGSTDNSPNNSDNSINSKTTISSSSPRKISRLNNCTSYDEEGPIVKNNYLRSDDIPGPSGQGSSCDGVPMKWKLAFGENGTKQFWNLDQYRSLTPRAEEASTRSSGDSSTATGSNPQPAANWCRVEPNPVKRQRAGTLDKKILDILRPHRENGLLKSEIVFEIKRELSNTNITCIYKAIRTLEC
jgi:hypothetical protein